MGYRGSTIRRFAPTMLGDPYHVEELPSYGYAHNTTVGDGDLTEALSFIADLMGMRKVFL